MTPDCRYLFVYGTLRRRSPHPMAALLARRGKFLGEAKMPGRLYNLGRYPGMLEPLTPDDWVEGDIYDLAGDDTLLAELDGYEEAESPYPAYFDRGLATATLADGTELTVLVYWFRGEVDEANRIASGRYM